MLDPYRKVYSGDNTVVNVFEFELQIEEAKQERQTAVTAVAARPQVVLLIQIGNIVFKYFLFYSLTVSLVHFLEYLWSVVPYRCAHLSSKLSNI